MTRAIRIIDDKKATFQQIFRLSLKHNCGIDIVRDEVFIVPQEILDELDKNGTRYEWASLTEEEAKTASILSAVSRRGI